MYFQQQKRMLIQNQLVWKLPATALFKGDFKIVRPPNGTNNWELFDLSKDPGETLNLKQCQKTSRVNRGL